MFKTRLLKLALGVASAQTAVLASHPPRHRCGLSCYFARAARVVSWALLQRLADVRAPSVGHCPGKQRHLCGLAAVELENRCPVSQSLPAASMRSEKNRRCATIQRAWLSLAS